MPGQLAIVTWSHGDELRNLWTFIWILYLDWLFFMEWSYIWKLEKQLDCCICWFFKLLKPAVFLQLGANQLPKHVCLSRCFFDARPGMKNHEKTAPQWLAKCGIFWYEQRGLVQSVSPVVQLERAKELRCECHEEMVQTHVGFQCYRYSFASHWCITLLKRSYRHITGKVF